MSKELTFTDLSKCDGCGTHLERDERLSGLCRTCEAKAREEAKRSWGRKPRKRPRP